MKQPGNLDEYGLFMMLKRYLKTSILSFLLFLIGCGTAMSNNDTKFEWGATESAPRHYPMEIIRGTFIYKGEIEEGLYIPNGGTLRSGWGKGISNHSVGEKFKPLPHRLEISFFSYTENQFYQGKFDLPYEKILSLFRQGVAANPRHPEYSKIMAGIAPGGVVAVWVKGTNNTEIFFGQAEKINFDPSAAFALPFKNKADSDKYVEEGLIESITPEELTALKKNGIPFGLWERYRNLYDWRLTLSEGPLSGKSNVKFLNGEFLRRWKPVKAVDVDILRPIPRRISFETVVNGVETIFIVHMDEFEMMDAFENLGTNNQKVYLEFEPRLPRTAIKVRLYNDKESIELKKIVSEDW